MSDFICQKYTDCSSCSHYQKQIFKYRSFPKGMMIPKERCSQNTIYFLISGSVRVTSDEHPDTVFHDGQLIMQPIGSRVEFHILESTECILYLFETPQNICTDRFNKGLELAKESPKKRQFIVLDAMVSCGYIDKTMAEDAKIKPLYLAH